MISLGVMQGRLVSKYKDRYQAFPVHAWQKEFQIAADLGLNCIEFILDAPSLKLNPLMTEEGVQEILQCIDQSGVKVWSICADYFMQKPLHGVEPSQKEESLKVLKTLVRNAAKIGVKDIVIPCVDDSSFHNNPQLIDEFLDVIKTVLPLAEENDVNLCLEVDLSPKILADIIKLMKTPRLKISYDSGNSASLGFNTEEEFTHYGQYVASVHVKDRKLGGGPVVLGEGNVDFDLFFSQLQKSGYQGPLILQAYRDEEGLEIFKTQLKWIKPYVEKYFCVNS